MSHPGNGFREVKLPSGAILKVQPAFFADAKALYQAILDELKSVHVGSHIEMASVVKDMCCIAFSSPKVEAALWPCLARCTYNSGTSGDLRIDAKTFEPVAAREDYTQVCMEVAEENIRPFVKSLFAVFQRFLGMIDAIPGSKPKTTSS